MTITETTTVADIATTIPSSVKIFQQHGVDFCCGGKRGLGDVCREHGLSFEAIAGAIEAAALGPGSDERDWKTAPFAELTEHIVNRYHLPLREELPRLESMANRVHRVHGSRAPHLIDRLDTIVRDLSVDLAQHTRKEETVLFPAIVASEQGVGGGIPLGGPIRVMMEEHDVAGAQLAELRSITDGYTLPDWACGTVRALYQGLEQLEADMHVHVHLENNVLFPRALDLHPQAV